MDGEERGYSGNKAAVRRRLRRIGGVAHAIEAGSLDATEKVREAAAAIERLVKS